MRGVDDAELPNAALVSPRWVQWRRTIDIADYDARFERLAASGKDVHGEADLIESLHPTAVLDAGCGTGRIAIELARRGLDVTGVDLDADMVAAAAAKAPGQQWIVDDLARMQLPRRFDLIAMPGNVMLFCQPDDRRLIVHNLAQHLLPGGLLVAGFSIERDGYSLSEWDAHCAASGLTLRSRYATWSCDPFVEGGDYHVSIHRRTERFTVHDLVAEARGRLQRVTPAGLDAALRNGDEIVVVDTRQPTDVQVVGSIPGSVHVPRTVLEWRLDPASGYSQPIAADPSQRLVLVCNDGYSSSLAAANLQRIGFPNATDLIGGFAAWRRAGLPVTPTTTTPAD
ncbi:MAG: SAM-dependent methyltransferase [Acidimicrobiales bacterium]|nr:SAM-dependent methyltransferase [Acidimicrobiales bacterium]